MNVFAHKRDRPCEPRPAGQVVGVLSRVLEGSVEMVQGSAVRLRLNGFISDKAVRLEPSRLRGLVTAGNDGAVLRIGPSDKQPALATLRTGAVVFTGQKTLAYIAVNRTVWVDKSRLAGAISPAAARSNAARVPVAAPGPLPLPASVKAAESRPAGSAPSVPAPATSAPATITLTNLSAAQLRSDPRGTKGKIVKWTVEALSYQLADGLRRELNGEPYLLARGPGMERAMLYLALPDSLVKCRPCLGAADDHHDHRTSTQRQKPARWRADTRFAGTHSAIVGTKSAASLGRGGCYSRYLLERQRYGCNSHRRRKRYQYLSL